jgi:hypothetical protein
MCQRNSFGSTAEAGTRPTRVTYCTIPVHRNLIPSYLNLGADKENDRNRFVTQQSTHSQYCIWFKEKLTEISSYIFLCGTRSF